MKTINLLTVISLILLSCSHQATKFEAGNSSIKYAGRTEKLSETEVALIASASSATMKYGGDSCIVYIKNNTPENKQNYISVELDGEYLGRYRVEGDSVYQFTFSGKKEMKEHTLQICKATEASNGNIIFKGILCESLLEMPVAFKKSIEFIGNSITCGFGVDYAEISCDSGDWYDQHNAYFAYGPVVSRMLDVNYMLSSVSGIGIYRNWNGVGPVMPMVYENMYLNLDSTKKWDFSRFSPDIVSICLGTNDFSDGDNIHERLPFSEEEFTGDYIRFVETVLSHYPNAQVVLLTSPMVSGEKNDVFVRCLKRVQGHFNTGNNKPIELFMFDSIIPHGCDTHPDINDEKMMAEQLFPFYKALLDKTSVN